MKKIIPLLLIAALSACKGDKTISLDSVPTTRLHGEVLAVSPEVSAPRHIYTTRGALVLFDSQNKEGFLSFFDKRTGERRAAYGTIGRGPGEYLSPRITETQKGLTLSSPGGDTYTLEFADSLEITPLPSKFQKETIGSNFIFDVDDSSVIFVKEGVEQLTILDKRSGEQTSKSYYPVNIGGATNPATLNNTIFQAHYAYHEDGRRLFMAYSYHPIISVVDVNDYSLVTHTRFDGIRNTLESDGENQTYLDPVLGYTFTSVSDNYFYALYQNADEATLRKNANEPEVHKYDLSGNFVERYVLDRPVYNFTVEKDDSKIYALSLDAEFIPRVLVFELQIPEKVTPEALLAVSAVDPDGDGAVGHERDPHLRAEDA